MTSDSTTKIKVRLFDNLVGDFKVLEVPSGTTAEQMLASWAQREEIGRQYWDIYQTTVTVYKADGPPFGAAMLIGRQYRLQANDKVAIMPRKLHGSHGTWLMNLQELQIHPTADHFSQEDLKGQRPKSDCDIHS